MNTVDFTRIPLEPGSVVLDVGCGSGRHTSAAFRMSGVTAVGMDREAASVAAARARLRLDCKLGEGKGKTEVLIGDVARLPFPDECFDLVICSEVLEHIADDRSAVQEMVRVLKSGKNLVVSVPRFGPERLCWALSKAYRSSEGGHIRIYRPRELALVLEGAGLSLWSRHFAHALHSPFWWLKCLVGPDRTDSRLINSYHRFLVWDLMKRPRLTRALERLLNPLFGKSVVMYLTKLAPGQNPCPADGAEPAGRMLL